METHSGSTALFGIFALSIFSLVLFPYTIYHAFFKESDAAQPWTDKAGVSWWHGRWARQPSAEI